MALNIGQRLIRGPGASQRAFTSKRIIVTLKEHLLKDLRHEIANQNNSYIIHSIARKIITVIPFKMPFFIK